ncbi:MAG TPA: hypothetical protein VGN97_01750 [Mesorhizobium sp.]|jgi:hypothetical protein|nr:hypothetical protein [Mesorhizobium sp.]
MPQDASLSLDATGSLEGPTPPALVPQTAAVESEPGGAFVGEPEEPAAVASMPTAQTATAADPSIASGATTVALAPLVGLPEGAAQNLAQALAARAPAHGLRLAFPGGGSSALVVKGYLAAVAAENGGAAVHVWDIYDAGGRRLHRVEGSHAMGEGATWRDLPPSAWDRIADQAWGELAAWLRTQRG